jgi:hypothetical protein
MTINRTLKAMRMGTYDLRVQASGDCSVTLNIAFWQMLLEGGY